MELVPKFIYRFNVIHVKMWGGEKHWKTSRKSQNQLCQKYGKTKVHSNQANTDVRERQLQTDRKALWHFYLSLSYPLPSQWHLFIKIHFILSFKNIFRAYYCLGLLCTIMWISYKSVYIHTHTHIFPPP